MSPFLLSIACFRLFVPYSSHSCFLIKFTTDVSRFFDTVDINESIEQITLLSVLHHTVVIALDAQVDLNISGKFYDNM